MTGLAIKIPREAWDEADPIMRAFEAQCIDNGGVSHISLVLIIGAMLATTRSSAKERAEVVFDALKVAEQIELSMEHRQ